MKKWYVIEDFINKKLVWLFATIQKFILTLIPKKLLSIYAQIINKTKSKIVDSVNFIKRKVFEFKNFVIEFVKKLKVTFRESLRGVFKKLDELKKLRIKDIDPKEIVLRNTTTLKLKIQDKFQTIKFKYQSVGWKNVALVSSLVIVFTLVLSQIYIRSKRIFIDAGIMRSPASFSEANSYPEVRPSYYKKDEKHLLIRSIRFPVYIGSKQSSRSISVDLTVTTSNKYTRAYLDENHYLVNDVFNTRIEPIVPAFPLQEEGKIILKEKIKKELNLLLKQLKIEGEIEEVHVHSITAS